MFRCQRCVNQKKGCTGGHPCDRCRHSGFNASQCVEKPRKGQDRQVARGVGTGHLPVLIDATADSDGGCTTSNGTPEAMTADQLVSKRGAPFNQNIFDRPSTNERSDSAGPCLLRSTGDSLPSKHVRFSSDVSEAFDALETNSGVNSNLSTDATSLATRAKFRDHRRPAALTPDSLTQSTSNSSINISEVAANYTKGQSSNRGSVELVIDENGHARVPEILRRPSHAMSGQAKLPPTKNFALTSIEYQGASTTGTTPSTTGPSSQPAGSTASDLAHRTSLKRKTAHGSTGEQTTANGDIQFEQVQPSRKRRNITGPPSLEDLLYRPSTGYRFPEDEVISQESWNTHGNGTQHGNESRTISIAPQLLLRHEKQPGNVFWHEPTWFETNEVCRYCEQSTHHHAEWCMEDPILQPTGLLTERHFH